MGDLDGKGCWVRTWSRWKIYHNQYIYKYVYKYIYIYKMCVCVCVFVTEKEKREEACTQECQF